MTAPFTIHVTGQGFAPWLAACIVARFGCPPQAVSVEARAGEGRTLLLRQTSMKWLSAIGVPEDQLARFGKPARYWGKPFGVELPIGEGNKAGVWIEEAAYEQGLAAVAKQAGIHVGRRPATLELAASPGAAADTLPIGAAASSSLGHAEVEHLAISDAASALAFAVPGDNPIPVELDEMRRRVARAVPVMSDMMALIGGTEPSQSLQHQIEVWRSLGHVCARDDDPFHADVWRAALTQRVGVPDALPLYRKGVPA